MDSHILWQHLPSKTKHLTLFAHTQSIAIYSSISDTLYGLEAQAAVLFLRLEQEESVSDILSGYAEKEQQDIANLLTEYEMILSERGVEDIASYAPPLAYPKQLPKYKKTGKYYQLLGTLFLIHAESISQAAQIDRYLGHLSPQVVTSNPDIVFEIKQQGDSSLVFINGENVHVSLTSERIYPFVQDWMRVTAYQRLFYLLTIHAAVLYKENKCILLPGASGAGKSTLTAALLVKGYQLLSDETAVVDLNDLGLYQVPMPIGLKEGSWSLLQKIYPTIDELPIHHRFDMKPVRYLIPPSSQSRVQQKMAATHIIFPQVIAEGRGQLEPLTPLAALAKLDNSGYQVQDVLGASKAEAILNWLTGLDAYQVKYNHFNQAVEAIERL